MRRAGVAVLMCDCVARRAAVSCELASGSGAAQSEATLVGLRQPCRGHAPRIGLRRTPQRPSSLLQARARGSMRPGAHLGCESPKLSGATEQARQPTGAAFQNRPSAYGRNPLSTRSWCAACAGAPCSALAEPVSTLHRRLDGAWPSRGGRKRVTRTVARCASVVISLGAMWCRVQRAARATAGSSDTP